MSSVMRILFGWGVTKGYCSAFLFSFVGGEQLDAGMELENPLLAYSLLPSLSLEEGVWSMIEEERSIFFPLETNPSAA